MSFTYGVLVFLVLTSGLFIDIKNCETSTTLLPGGRDKEVNKTYEKKSDIPPAGTVGKESPPTGSFQPIVEKNIFSPERKEFPAPSSETGMSVKPKARPQVILYGITLAGNYQSASVVNPGRSVKKGERELMTVKVGELIGDYKVANILSDKITLEAEGDHFEVLLYDPKMLKKRVDIRTESKPAMISSAGASPTAPGEVKREVLSAQEATQPPTRPARVEVPRPASSRERSEEPREPGPAPVTPPPVTTQPLPGGMTPTTVTPTMVPQSVPVPPGMGTPVQPLPTTPSQTPGKN